LYYLSTMKTSLFLFLIISIGCTLSSAQTTKEPSRNVFLVSYKSDLEKDGRISNTPLLVVDGYQYNYQDFVENGPDITKDKIYVTGCLDKSTGSNIYGSNGSQGVILITTKMVRLKSATVTRNSKVLGIVDGVHKSKEEIRNIKSEEVESIEVIEGEKLKTYAGDYDNIFIITTRKK
jgi:hypothetical protein